MKRALFKSISRILFACLAILFATAVSCAHAEKVLEDADQPVKDETALKVAASENEAGFFKSFYKNDPDMYYVVWGGQVVEVEDGYVLVNTIFDDSGPRTFEWIIRFDEDWNILWEKEMGKEAHDANLGKVLFVDDKSLVLVGSIEETGEQHRSPSAWIVRINLDDGKIEWQRTRRFGDETRAVDVEKTDRGIVVAGIVRVGDAFEHMDWGFITEMSLDGKIIWTNHFEKAHWINNVVPYKDGFIAGGANWLARLDRRGEIIWERTLEGIGQLETIIFRLFFGDSLLISGKSEHPWLRKLSPDGSVEWIKTLDYAGLCEIVTIWMVDGGGFVVVGETCKENKERIWAGLFDSSGELKETKMFLDKGKCLDTLNDVATSIPSGDDGFITVGSVAEVEGGCWAGWVYKTRLGFIEESK